MALITRSADASLDASTGAFADQLSGNLYAGEALDPVAPCYIKNSDGLVYMTNGTSNNEASRVHGFTARAVPAGQPVTLYGAGARFRYGTGLTPGAPYYAGATAGRLDDGATTGGTIPLAHSVNATDIRVVGYKVAHG